MPRIGACIVRSWRDSLKRSWAGLRLAHQAVMIQDAQRLLADSRSQVRRHHKMPEPKDNDDHIHIGDLTQNITNAAPAAGTRPFRVSWILALVLATAAGGGLTWLACRPAPSMAPVEPVELMIHWWVEDGQPKTKVERIK